MLMILLCFMDPLKNTSLKVLEKSSNFCPEKVINPVPQFKKSRSHLKKEQGSNTIFLLLPRRKGSSYADILNVRL